MEKMPRTKTVHKIITAKLPIASPMKKCLSNTNITTVVPTNAHKASLSPAKVKKIGQVWCFSLRHEIKAFTTIAYSSESMLM